MKNRATIFTEVMKMKKASSFFFWILRVILKPVLFFKYGCRFRMEKSKRLKRPCIILSNHQTAFDFFNVGCIFRFGINFVASETIFRHGFKSRLMEVLAHPIAFSKGSTDPTAVKQMMKVIKLGGSVGMFPSGNQSFFGEESHINPAVGKLCKKLGVPVYLVNVRGGYLTKARWKKKPSKGRIEIAVTKIIEPEELKNLSAEEIFETVKKELSVNDFEYNKERQIKYKGKKKAEYLESVLFYCPRCESLHALKSEGNEFFCTECGARVAMNQFGFFDQVEHAENLPGTVLDWGRAQLEFIKRLDFTPYGDKPVFRDGNVRLLKGQRAKKEQLLGTGGIALFSDRITVCGKDFLIADIKDMAIRGIRKMSIYTDDAVYAVECPYRVNLLKYMVCGYRLKNRGDGGGEEYYGY